VNMVRPVRADGDMRPARRLLGGGLIVLLLFGLLRADTADGFIGYLMITIAAVIPAALWLRARAPGIPILPVIAAFHYLYFAVPILRNSPEQAVYASWEILRAASTVALFLIVATVAWGLFLGPSFRSTPRPSLEFSTAARAKFLVGVGIAFGVIFQLAVMQGWVEWSGVYFGVIRAIAVTVASIACYLAGHLRGRRVLHGQAWILTILSIAFLVVLNWCSLFLVGGMQYVLATVLGYVITTKRLPWAALTPVLVILFVLHAGKGEMRDRYWTEATRRPLHWSKSPAF
jgi:hypothetical protein